MSLENPTFLEKATAIAFSKTGLLILGLIIVLVGSALYITDCGSNYFFNRGVKKDKEAIANNLDKATEAKANIAENEKVLVGVNTNINAHTEDLLKQVYGREEIKVQVNQAIANYQIAVSTNTNVDRTAEDLKRKIQEIPE
jgi:hypothetical protein